MQKYLKLLPPTLSPKKRCISIEKLEKRTKRASAIYIFLLFLGTGISVFDLGDLIENVRTSQLWFLILITFGIIGLLLGLMSLTSNMKSLTEIRSWLDQQFFGYLEKSNDTILRSLLGSLSFHEQNLVRAIEGDRKNVVAKSVLSHLAHDYRLNETLMDSGIFHIWTWYWISVYGTFTYSLLTIESFIVLLLGFGHSVTTVFMISCPLALTHFGVCSYLGSQLIKMNKQTLDEIVRSHKDEIAGMLRESLRQVQDTS